MKKHLAGFGLILSIFFISCSSRPTDQQIEQRILYQYTCAESARVTGLKIVDSKETDGTEGTRVVEYTVSGTVEWPRGCNEFASVLPAGHKIPFANKIVLFVKTDEGWQ